MRPRLRSRLSPRRFLLFASVTAVLVFGAAFVALLAADMYLHAKYQTTAGVNIWGYRGPTLGRKADGEVRVAVFGGSTAFGYGPAIESSFPYLLEQSLNSRGVGRYSVVNLAYNNEDAYAFKFTMEDYEYLGFDIAILYEGYNDIADRPRYQVFRRESPIFRLTGYLPIFPVIFKEKAWAMLYGGDVSRGYSSYRGDAAASTVFQPGLATQATAKALEAAAYTAQSLERQLGRLTRDLSDANLVTTTAGCSDRWQHYCGAVYDAIQWARARGKGVLVGTQPYVSDQHIDQQNALAGLLHDRFASDRAVRHVNLGRAVDLKNRELAFDGMHLLEPGNRIIAAGFVDPVIEMARELGRR